MTPIISDPSDTKVGANASDADEKRGRRCEQRLRWYYANKERQLAGDKVRHEHRRAQIRACIDDHLAAHPCVDCGETDPIVLDFDHVGEKAFGIATAAAKLKPLSAVLAEIAKCEIRCANCHRRKTHRTHGHRNKSATITFADGPAVQWLLRAADELRNHREAGGANNAPASNHGN